MKNFEYRNVNINSIYVWKLNPRHEEADNEKEAIEYLFKTVGDTSMNNLARDIGEKGLSPYDLPIIVEVKNEKNKYFAYEGNRRIAVIKSILNPELLNFDNNLHEKYQQFNLKYSEKINKKIYSVLTDHDTAIDEIEKIHSGELSGVGRKKWGSLEKDMFNVAFRDKTSIALNITNAINETLKKDIITTIKTTNIKRIFSNKDIKELLNTEDYSNLSDNDVYIINGLIEKAVEIEKIEHKALSRMFNTQEAISEFFVPITKELKSSQIKKGFIIRADNGSIKENDIFNSSSLNIVIYDQDNNQIEYKENELNINYINPKGLIEKEINTSLPGRWQVQIKYYDYSTRCYIRVEPITTPKLRLKESNTNINIYESYTLIDNILEAKNSLGNSVINKVLISNVGIKEAKIENNIFLGINEEGEYTIKYELLDENCSNISKVLNIIVSDKKEPLKAKKNDDNRILSVSDTYNTEINISSTVNTLINQLGKLDVNEYDYVIATSLRALIELTVDEVISKKDIQIEYVPKEDKLLTRTKRVVNELQNNISKVCIMAPSKFNYHTANNFLKSFDTEKILDFLNLSAHKSLKIITKEKLLEVSKKDISLLLVLIHFYLIV